jgi:glucose-fructose oxidoreductase
VRSLPMLIFFLCSILLSGASAQASSPQAARSAPLRVGIVGLVHGHVDGFFQGSLHNPDIQLVGVAEPDQQVLMKYASHYALDPKLLFRSLEQMLQTSHPQAVLVYTNTYDHRIVVEVCARYGVHVMMEKPLAVSLSDARAIQESAVKNKIYVLVNYETTWYPSNRAAYGLARENALGELRRIVVHDGHQGPKEINVPPEFLAWLTDPKLNGGGALFDFGCYGADLATWLMEGRRPDSVTAITQRIKPDVYRNVDDEATIILTYPRTQVIIQASWNWPFGRKDMELYGTSGSVITVGRDELRVQREEGHEERIPAKPIPAPYDNSIAYLKAVVNGEIQPEGLSSLDTNLIVTEILDAARRSAASGKSIPLSH